VVKGKGSNCEPAAQDSGIYRLEGYDIRERDMFVDLVHGLADQAELDNRAMRLDETGI
jgi:hypothetical protein